MRPATEIPVESGVPLPHPSHSAVKYPFSRMQVGQSFLFPETIGQAAARSAVHSANGNLYPCKFTTRKVRGGNGLRCWRLK